MGHRLASEAEADLDEIWLFVAKESGSMDTADRLIDTITERVWMLTRNPYAGRSRAKVWSEGLRSVAVGANVIVYRVEGEEVVVLRVLHGRRNLPDRIVGVVES